MAERTELETVLEELDGEYNVLNHPFFRDLIDGKISRADLARILAPFYFVACHWLEHLKEFHEDLNSSGKTESAELARRNIENELGGNESSDEYDYSKTRTTAYLNFLVSMGLDRPLVLVGPVKKFNQSLNRLEIYAHALHACVLGGIERYHASINNLLSKILGHMPPQGHEFREFCATGTQNLPIPGEHYPMDFFTMAMLEKPNTDVREMKPFIKIGYILLWNLCVELYQDFKETTN